MKDLSGNRVSSIEDGKTCIFETVRTASRVGFCIVVMVVECAQHEQRIYVRFNAKISCLCAMVIEVSAVPIASIMARNIG